ncbi:MAG: DUF4091 domain-containing protein [Planctomycetota bacterium]|nr:DUF4091 domain-containing protein [Planctomycetota bacterium]
MRRLIRSVISLVLCASPLVAQAGSLLRNGDFEDTEFSPWIVQRWNGECDVELDRTFANAGRGSAGFGSDRRCKIALVQDLGRLDAGSYILKGYVRAINLRQGQWKRTFLVGLETPEKELFLDKIPGGTYGWRPFTRAYTINQPINGKLYLYLFGPCRLWLDGLSLERIKPEGAVSDNRGLVLGEEEGSLSSVIAESRGDIRCSLCSGGHPAGTQSCKFCGFDIASSRKAEHEFELINGGHEIAGPNLIQRLKAGDGLFLAVCIYPSVPPNLFIEYDLLDARIFPWIGYRTGSKGFEYWDLFQWGNNVGNTDWLTRGDGTRTAWKLDNPHGDGLLMYPGPNGVPLSSLRLESFRDGLEDYEYLLKLQARSETDPFAAALLKEATEVIVTGVTSYTREPAQLLNLRVRIAKFLSTDVARSGQ